MKNPFGKKHEKELRFTEEEWQEKQEKEREETIKTFAEATITVVVFVVIFFSLIWLEGVIFRWLDWNIWEWGEWTYGVMGEDPGPDSVGSMSLGGLIIIAINFYIVMKITKKVFSDRHKPIEGLTVAFPRNYNNQISKEVVTTRGLDGCLYIFNPAEWNKIKERFKKLELEHRLTDNQAKLFNLMVKDAYRAEISKEDTLFIPGFLREYARIKKDIVSMEISNCLEIWAKEEFEKRKGMKLPDPTGV